MIRVHCDQDDVELGVSSNPVKIRYSVRDKYGEEILWDLVFCNEMCSAAYLSNIGRERMMKDEQA